MPFGARLSFDFRLTVNAASASSRIVPATMTLFMVRSEWMEIHYRTAET